MSGRLETALHGIGLAAAAWCLSDLFTGTRLPLYRDLLPFIYPYRAFLAEYLARGEVPLWNPFLQLGVPFAASLHASVFYPPSLLLLIPLPLGFNLFLLAHFVIAWAGASVWLREAGASRAGAIAGTVVFTIGGYLVASITNTAHLQAAVWAPWILFVWARACRDSGAGLIATPFLLVIQLLGGAPEVWAATVALATAWTFFCGPSTIGRRAGLAVRFGICVAVSLALAAFQLFPTVEYIAASRRGTPLSYDEITYWSMNPASLLQLLFPPSTVLVGEGERGTIGALLAPRLPWIQSVYLGIGGLCLAVTGIVEGRERVFWTLAALAGAFLALGTYSPLYDALLVVAPGIFARMRYPEKFLFVFHLAAVVLVAHGATTVFQGSRRALRLSIVVAVALGAVALGLTLLGWFAPRILPRIAGILSGRGDWPLDAFTGAGVDLAYKAERALWLLGGWAALAALRLRGRLSAPVFAVLVVSLLAGDLAAAHRRLWVSIPVNELENVSPLPDVERLRDNRQRIYHYDTATRGTPVPGLVERHRSLDERTDLRRFAIEARRTLYSATGMLFGVGNVTASDSIGALPDLERVLARLPREAAVDLLGVFGVATLIGPTELPLENVERIASSAEGSIVYRVLPALPFAHLATELEVVDGVESALLRLAAPSFPGGHGATVERIPSGWTEAAGPLDAEDAAHLRSAGSDEIELEVTATGVRLLVINQAFFPGWRAEIDGRPAAIVRANALVQGVVVPPGRHAVRLEYRPSSFRFGIALSLVALAGVAFAAVVWVRRA